jgi:hypothetical protein
VPQYCLFLPSHQSGSSQTCLPRLKSASGYFCRFSLTRVKYIFLSRTAVKMSQTVRSLSLLKCKYGCSDNLRPFFTCLDTFAKCLGLAVHSALKPSLRVPQPGREPEGRKSWNKLTVMSISVRLGPQSRIISVDREGCVRPVAFTQTSKSQLCI